MNIGSRNFNSNFAHHRSIIIHWSIFKVWIESLHINSYQRETIYDKVIFFAKLVRQWKSKEWAKFEMDCLILIFIYSYNKISYEVEQEKGMLVSRWFHFDTDDAFDTDHADDTAKLKINFRYFRGNCTPNKKLACFALYRKIVNTFLKKSIIYQIFQTQK